MCIYLYLVDIEGEGGGLNWMEIHEITIQIPNRQYEAPTYNTKPPSNGLNKAPKTIKSPNRQQKAPKDFTKPKQLKQKPTNKKY